MSRANLTFIRSWYSRTWRAMSCLARCRASSRSLIRSLASFTARSPRPSASRIWASRLALYGKWCRWCSPDNNTSPRWMSWNIPVLWWSQSHSEDGKSCGLCLKSQPWLSAGLPHTVQRSSLSPHTIMKNKLCQEHNPHSWMRCWKYNTNSLNKRINLNFHLLFVPGLCFSLAAVCDVLILSTHFSHYRVHVQVTAVVHLHDDGGILDLALQFPKLLQKEQLMPLTLCPLSWHTVHEEWMIISFYLNADYSIMRYWTLKIHTAS